MLLMKSSRYNIFIDKEGRKFVYNQLHSSLLEIDDDLARLLKTSEIDSLEDDLKGELFRNGIICEKTLQESHVLLAKNKQMRFASDFARLTILPTVNCNFHCWYCYESHKESTMTEEGCKRVLAFCKELIENGKLKMLQLDWFGGEPLLCFEQVVFPLSKQVKALCQEHGITFLNTITTNGSLVTDSMIEAFMEIDLLSFQITLDGGKSFHNKTRFSKELPDSFSAIVNNISKMCRKMPRIDMEVRINYTPKNLQSIDEIVETFPKDVRHQLTITPQLVWQFKDSANMTSPIIKEKMGKFISAGYKKTHSSLGVASCYTENMKQFVINYDLFVYKCTARDFRREMAIGRIQEDGTLSLFPHYYDYYMSSGMERQECMECNFLPSCFGPCLQKRVESAPYNCDKEKMEESIVNNVLLYIQQQEDTI